MAEKISPVMLTDNVKAFVNFDGTGTPTIRAAFNISSIVDKGAGIYGASFVANMQSNSYVPQVTCGLAAGNRATHIVTPADILASEVTVNVFDELSGSMADTEMCSVTIHEVG